MKVDAIISAYYAAEFLNKRIENLLSQTLVPNVVVVAQEGSREEEIARSFSVQVCTTPDIPTVYKAWNIGILNSSADYITNANSDDKLVPTAIELMAKALDENIKAQVVYPDVLITDGYEGEVNGAYHWAEGGLAELMNGCFIGPMPMWRRSLHARAGMFNDCFSSAGDYDMWLRIAKEFGNGSLHHIPLELGIYAKRKDSLEHRSYIAGIWESARARGKQRKLYALK